jgi:uncharacterized protein (TIGR01777 family)
MKIVVAGASGLIGRATVSALRHAGHEVIRLVRRPAAAPDEAFWDPATGTVPLEACLSAKAVINLCGASVAERWTAKRRDEIRASRILATRALAKIVGGTISEGPKPSLLVNASATGYYGDRGNLEVDELSAPGMGFLAEVCKDWEAEAMAAEGLGARVVCVRFGLVLSADGGILRRLIPFYRAGLGCPIGLGRQWMSWIELEDAVGVVLFALDNASLSGPVNAVSPGAVMHSAFCRALGRIFGRQLPIPIPPLALRLALGPMADETLLTSLHALPAKLLEANYPYRYRVLEDALNNALAAEKVEA